MGDGAFENCSSLTRVTVTIPDSVRRTGSYAFRNRISLSEVTIGKRVNEIGDETFYGCSSLKNVTIGSSVTEIGNYAFNGCSSLSAIYFVGEETDWNVTLGTNNSEFEGAAVYYYSDEATSSGKGWHYDDEGTPAVW